MVSLVTYRRLMATAKTTTIRMTAEDLAILDAAQEKHGMVSRSEALRFVLRFYARGDGIEIGKPKPAKRTKK
jgi:hypothetical protein